MTGRTLGSVGSLRRLLRGYDRRLRNLIYTDQSAPFLQAWDSVAAKAANPVA